MNKVAVIAVIFLVITLIATISILFYYFKKADEIPTPSPGDQPTPNPDQPTPSPVPSKLELDLKELTIPSGKSPMEICNDGKGNAYIRIGGTNEIMTYQNFVLNKADPLFVNLKNVFVDNSGLTISGLANNMEGFGSNFGYYKSKGYDWSPDNAFGTNTLLPYIGYQHIGFIPQYQMIRTGCQNKDSISYCSSPPNTIRFIVNNEGKLVGAWWGLNYLPDLDEDVYRFNCWGSQSKDSKNVKILYSKIGKTINNIRPFIKNNLFYISLTYNRNFTPQKIDTPYVDNDYISVSYTSISDNKALVIEQLPVQGRLWYSADILSGDPNWIEVKLGQNERAISADIKGDDITIIAGKGFFGISPEKIYYAKLD